MAGDMTKGWTVEVRLRQTAGGDRLLWPWEVAIPDRAAAEHAVRERLAQAGAGEHIVRAAREIDDYEIEARGLTPGIVRQVLMP